MADIRGLIAWKVSTFVRLAFQVFLELRYEPPVEARAEFYGVGEVRVETRRVWFGTAMESGTCDTAKIPHLFGQKHRAHGNPFGVAFDAHRSCFPARKSVCVSGHCDWDPEDTNALPPRKVQTGGPVRELTNTAPKGYSGDTARHAAMRRM